METFPLYLHWRMITGGGMSHDTESLLSCPPALPRGLRLLALLSALSAPVALGAGPVLVEAEAFASHGGWTLDTQFIDIMGSPYLLAHGLGTTVADATTTVDIPAAGQWHVHVRTKDWVAPWQATGAPGRFRVSIDGQPLPQELGNTGAEWHWQNAGTVTISQPGPHKLALQDLTGFDGRCDAIFLSQDARETPPADRAARRSLMGLPATPPESAEYDLVVCGGGYAGMGAAIAAARQGLKVALLQNRPVLGGNGSSEIQVWAQGGTCRGIYPHLGEIVEEFADRAKNSPGVAEEYGDAKKEALIRSEPNIDLFLNHHVTGVEMESAPESKGRRIRSVVALDTRTAADRRFRSRLFADCTGHGSVGAAAGASFTMLEKGHLGMSNMWSWQEAAAPVSWEPTPWALALEWGDFPATRKAETGAFHKGEWFWESGFDQHPLHDLEKVRDWNLRAVFGAFSAMKHGAKKEEYATARLAWVASNGGTRESRMLTGDVVLSQEDIVNKVEYPDGCVPTTWDLDLHYPKEQYAKKFPDNPFISRAQFGKGVDRQNGYPVPYRCFYSKDVENLFMAGRCISVTHEALGTVRVMRTCGMMGEVVGRAAWLAIQRKTTPRGVYQSHLDELKELWRQPGAARRKFPDAPLTLPANWVAPEGYGPPVGLRPASLGGIVVDDAQARLTGSWTAATSLPGYVAAGYRYASGGSDATASWDLNIETEGRYEVRISWGTHPNRATNVPCNFAGQTFPLNMRQAPTGKNGFHSLGVFPLSKGTHTLTISAAGADGVIHADAVQAIPEQPAK